MTGPYDDQERRAAEWHGWRPSTAPACPRVAAGLRCLDMRCTCRRHRHLLDHGRCWIAGDGSHVVTGEPYDTWGEELAAFLVDCADLGLRVAVTGRSLWNPGSALLLIVERETLTRLGTGASDASDGVTEAVSDLRERPVTRPDAGDGPGDGTSLSPSPPSPGPPESDGPETASDQRLDTCVTSVTSAATQSYGPEADGRRAHAGCARTRT